jgi:hypothetical protein
LFSPPKIPCWPSAKAAIIAQTPRKRSAQTQRRAPGKANAEIATEQGYAEATGRAPRQAIAVKTLLQSQVLSTVTTLLKGSSMPSDATLSMQKQIIANQKKIIANQQRIQRNQAKLDKIVANQKKLDQILANQKAILARLR